MKALLPTGHVEVSLNADDPIQTLQKPFLDVENSDYLIAGSAGEFEAIKYIKFRDFIFMGPGGGGNTIRLESLPPFMETKPKESIR